MLARTGNLSLHQPELSASGAHFALHIVVHSQLELGLHEDHLWPHWYCCNTLALQSGCTGATPQEH